VDWLHGREDRPRKAGLVRLRHPRVIDLSGETAIAAIACYHLNEAVVKQVDADNNTVVVTTNGAQKTFTTYRDYYRL
jgi:hypothetical protein